MMIIIYIYIYIYIYRYVFTYLLIAPNRSTNETNSSNISEKSVPAEEPFLNKRNILTPKRYLSQCKVL